MINEKKAFTLIKKSDNVQVYKDSVNAYWVTDGRFVFRTFNTESLVSLGLIDFNGNPRENNERIKNCIENTAIDVELKYTGILFEFNKRNVALLTSNSGFTAINDAYLKLFFNPFTKFNNDSVFSFASGTHDIVYVWENKKLIGFILPIRLNGEHLSFAEKLFKGA